MAEIDDATAMQAMGWDAISAVYKLVYGGKPSLPEVVRLSNVVNMARKEVGWPLLVARADPEPEAPEGEREVHEVIADAWLTDEEEWEDRDGNIQRTYTVTTDPHGGEEPATAVRLIQTRENLALEDRPEHTEGDCEHCAKIDKEVEGSPPEGGTFGSFREAREETGHWPSCPTRTEPAPPEQTKGDPWEPPQDRKGTCRGCGLDQRDNEGGSWHPECRWTRDLLRTRVEDHYAQLHKENVELLNTNERLRARLSPAPTASEEPVDISNGGTIVDMLYQLADAWDERGTQELTANLARSAANEIRRQWDVTEKGVARLMESERDQAGRTKAEAWRDAAIQAKNDLRAIEEAFAEATPVNEVGPDPPIGPGARFAQWSPPAVTMRWIEELEGGEPTESEERGEGPNDLDSLLHVVGEDLRSARGEIDVGLRNLSEAQARIRPTEPMRRVSRSEWEAIERTLNERGMTDPRDLWVANEVRELLGIEIEGEEGGER